jgi:hypothetical protein
MLGRGNGRSQGIHGGGPSAARTMQLSSACTVANSHAGLLFEPSSSPFKSPFNITQGSSCAQLGIAKTGKPVTF